MRTNKNGVNKDQKDKVKKDGYNRGQHCVYCLTYHIIDGNDLEILQCGTHYKDK